jgi:orotidine-5'-phosphate decarboxylase
MRLAELALESGAPGLVCSPREVALLRERFGTRDEGGPLLVVPGIRPEGAGGDDQKRTLGPSAALEAGADVLVIGRPITEASEPVAAAAEILASVEGARG